MKYKEFVLKTDRSMLRRFLSSEKNTVGIIKRILKVFLYPFRGKLNNSLWASGNLKKMINNNNYEEGYEYGLKRLFDLSNTETDSVFWPAQYTNWWSLFEQTCSCALEVNREDSLVVLSNLFKKGPGPKDGLGVSISCCKLALLASKKNDFSAAWCFIEEAIKSDESYGYSFYLRAWLGIKLNRGQVLDDLILAIKYQPEVKNYIFNDDLFKRAPELLNKLTVEIKKLEV